MSISSNRYTGTARLLHWGMAVLVLLMIPAGLVMVQPGLDRSVQNLLFVFHKNTGILLLFLIVLRIAYRWRHPPAALPADLPNWQRKLAGLSHGVLYGFLVVLPVAGYVRVKAGGFPIEVLDALGVPALVPRSDVLAAIAKTVHYGGGLAIGGLIVVHVAAAGYHGIVRRDGVFSRMWPPVGTRPD